MLYSWEYRRLEKLNKRIAKLRRKLWPLETEHLALSNQCDHKFTDGNTAIKDGVCRLCKVNR